MVFLIVCLLVGLGLGLRFKVLVLVPVATLAVAIAISARITGGDAFWSLLMAAAAAASLQIGYLIGLCIRYLVSARANSARVSSLPGASPTQ